MMDIISIHSITKPQASGEQILNLLEDLVGSCHNAGLS